MAFCPAAVTAGAIFTALIVRDIYLQTYKEIPFHLVGAIFSVLGLSMLCRVASDTVAWAVFLVPFFVLIVGFYIQWAEGQKSKDVAVASPMPTPCPVCAPSPCGCRRRRRCPTPEAPSVAPPPPSVVSVKPNPAPSSFGCPAK